MRFRPFLCLLVCLISTNAFTQTLTFSDPPLGISRSSAEVGVADFDGDGFNDIAVANASQRWYRGPNFTEWFTIGTADGGPYAAQVADVNGDGYADFVTSDGARNEADYPGHVYLYLNPRGTGGDVTQPWTRIVVYSGNVRHQNDMRLVDIDGDGRLDILEKTWSATERVLIAFQNADINNWTVRTFDTGETGKPEGISAGDLDGGGDVEIVQSGVYWKSSGNWRTDTFEQYSIDLAFYASTYDKTKSEVGDLDNDGDLDVYLGSAEGSELKLAWYENTGLGPGGGIAWTEHLIKDNTGDYHGIALKDIDQDGDIDLVAGKGFGQKGCSVFYNNNNGASWTEQNFDPDGNLYTLQVADLDADGDLDIVGPNGFNDPVKYYLNETPADPPVAPTGLIASLKNGRNVLLNWTDNSAEEGAYLLERIAGNDWQLLASLPANTTSFLDETTQPATAYRYRVRATNGGGASENAVSETLTTWAEAGTISANPPAGNFLDPPLVTLSGMLPSGEIRYTLDGSIPNATSPLYTTPLLLEQSLLLRAVALGPMLLPSEEFSGFYNVAIDGNFPPLADAGPDQALVSLSEVLLDGSNSVDFDDPLDSLVFSWSQISGPPANLVGIEEDSARFTPTLVGDYVFELTVADEASDDRDTVLIQVADLDADLVAYWPFNEPSGMVASEIVDGKNATLTTGNSFSEGLFGNALAVDGENGRAEAPAIDVLGDSLTITAWIKAADLDNVEGRIVSKAAGTNGNDHIWMLSQNGGSALRFRLNTGGPTTTLISESG
ncbi:MAG: FG-GAP-like repeat-containing protein, partial [Bacteroidota bacterium]